MSERGRYEGKVAVITGGARGIGKGCVECFVHHGSNVVFCDINGQQGAKAETEINSKHAASGQAVFLEADTKSEEDVKRLMESTVSRFGRIDCLINNAGWHPPAYPIDAFSSTDFRKLLELNLEGYFLTAKYALPYLRQNQGNIINIASAVGTIGQREAVTYCATKGGVAAMSRALAIDEAKFNVRVNAISPGSIWTPLFEEWASSIPNAESVLELEKKTNLLQRFGTPEEVAKACLFLAADGTFCTGVDLLLTAGAELGYGVKR